MKLNDIEAGTKLELEISNSINEEKKLVLISEFEWADNESTAVIAAPILEGAIYNIHIGALMNVYFILDGELYKLKARVMERKRIDNIALLGMKILGDIERIQRRQFFRFEYSLPFKYRIVEEPNNSNDSKTDKYSMAITRDLGGGGLCILIEEKIDEGIVVEGELELSEKEKAKFSGKIIRVSKRESEGKYNYDAAIEFYQIDNKVRETIIKYIFEQQRKLRKKGLI
jgi:c-di-GMP-binding flagellar brake protein YcgR